jgi:hypothetical protein
MGYHLTIIRPNDKPIRFNELVEASCSIGQFRVDESNKNISIEINGEVLYVHCINQIVFTDNVTSNQVIKKLVHLAQALDGRLRGDEMETYREDGTSFTHPEDSDEFAHHEKGVAKIVRRRKIIKIGKAVILVIILVIATLTFV